MFKTFFKLDLPFEWKNFVQNTLSDTVDLL